MLTPGHEGWCSGLICMYEMQIYIADVVTGKK